MVLFSLSLGQTIHEKNRDLAQSVNLGNALEAPSEGLWGLELEEAYFDEIKQAGFTSIRLPISWTHHAALEAPYEIDTAFFERVDWAVQQATQRGLTIIINVHHYDALNANPIAEEERYLALWQQIAQRYASASEAVYFELLNEPHGRFNDDAQIWNDLLAKTINSVRESNKTRPIIVGPVGYNNIDRLSDLVLPADPNLIVTVHFYDPFDFTHQGANWVSPQLPTGVKWTGQTPLLAWQNWSWDTRVTWQDQDTLELKFEQAGAGFYLHTDNSDAHYDTLIFETNQARSLALGCQDELQALSTYSGLRSYRIDLRECSSTTDLIIQNASSESQVNLTLSKLELQGEKGSLSLLVDQEEIIRQRLDTAKAWADQQGYPLFLGEFGAYEAADFASRVRWTSFMRSELEKRDIAWAYWEFGAGFGLYDPVAKVWRQDLLEALIP